ncbi:MAG: DUF1934 domain-containing protein [Angelakisella sp.]|jgi:uncharacterized beta-barrel protein YwiB (DUF1934 family)|nr:DUF1934 domain-containing protein [Angelakisella sp.]
MSKQTEALIKIRGIQRVDGDNDVVELLTTGFFSKRKDGYLISYEESEATGFEGASTTLLYEEKEDRVTLTRTGSVNSQLIVEKGKRHQCSYDLGFGSMIIGVSCDHLQSTLSSEGGNISFGYSLDLNTALTSENHVLVSVVPQPHNQPPEPKSPPHSPAAE